MLKTHRYVIYAKRDFTLKKLLLVLDVPLIVKAAQNVMLITELALMAVLILGRDSSVINRALKVVRDVIRLILLPVVYVI